MNQVKPKAKQHAVYRPVFKFENTSGEDKPKIIKEDVQDRIDRGVYKRVKQGV